MSRRGFFGLLAAVLLLPKRVYALTYNRYEFDGKAFRAGFKIPRGTCLGKYRHNWRAVKVGEITSSPGLLWSITDEGLDE